METMRIIDGWNPAKTWIVKRYACGHYYITQEVSGRQLYPFTRWNKKTTSCVAGISPDALRVLR